MRRSLVRGRIALIAGMVLAIALTAAVTNAAPNHRAKPDRVVTKSDGAKAKLAPELVRKLDSGSTASVPVFVSLRNGDVAATRSLLTADHVAKRGELALVVGRVRAQQLAKLAAIAGVLSVEPVDFAQTGRPDVSNPDGFRQPDKKTANENLREFQKNSVPYYKAPPLKTSNFDQLASANVLDAKTHNFTGAWKQGFTGDGITASVLDGGTDWGHPDLIGTWQTWTQDELDALAADGAPVDPNWAGWPKAFDPYDTLVYLVAPDFVDQGLTWYTKTTATPVGCGAKRNSCFVQFATLTGPSRNLPVDPGTAMHSYKVDQSWSKSGTVMVGSHPDDHLLDLYGERPAFVVTDPHVAGVYDTVYVDLDDNYDFTDEKPVTKRSPVSYRDLNGDGYTDLSGGLLYYISDGHTLIPGGPTDFGVGDTPAAGSFLAWTGDFDPAIEGHGTLTASNVVGQAVINGKSPEFKDVKIKKAKDHEIPGMVLGGAPDTKLAPMGDIYFSFAFSTQFGYLLTNEYGVQVTSNSYGNSDDDNDGMDPASQEADLIHAGIGGNTVTPVFSTGNGAPGFGTATSPSPVRGISVGASTQFGGTGWDSIKNISQVTDNDVIEWSNRGPGANGRGGVDVVADGSYSTGDATLNTVIDGRNAWETWGGTSRSTPVTVGAVALIYQAYAASHGRRVPERAAGTLDPQVERAGPELRLVRPGSGLGRRRQGCNCRPGPARPREPGRVAAEQLGQRPRRAAADRRGRVEDAGVHADRPGDVEPVRPATAALRHGDVPVHVGAARPGERVELQRARLPDGHHEQDQGAFGCRHRRDPGELPAVGVRRRRELPVRPGVAASRLQLDRPRPQRPALEGQERQRRRQPRRQEHELEHRRLQRHQLREVGDGRGRVRAVLLPPPRRQHTDGLRPQPGPAHGRRRVPRFPALDEEQRHRPDALHDPDRLLQERRLELADHAGDRDGLVQRHPQRPGRHAGRDVRGCDRRVQGR